MLGLRLSLPRSDTAKGAPRSAGCAQFETKARRYSGGFLSRSLLTRRECQERANGGSTSCRWQLLRVYGMQ